MKRIAYILILMLVVAACNTPTPRERKDIGDKNFTSAYVKFYGSHYASRGIENNVIDLDLYSEGLSLDSTGHIVGTGTNVYLSDIFIAKTDSALIEGSYVSDTTGGEYTFLPGVNYDGNISGAYLLRITDGVLSAYTLFDRGEMMVEQEDDSVLISLKMKYEESGIERTYEAEGKVKIEEKK